MKARSEHFFTLPNALSYFRGVCGLSIPFLVLSHQPALHAAAFLLFLVGAVTDYLDGWTARRYGLVSDAGKITDPTMDKILILAPMAAFAARGYYSVWWAVPFFVREITVTFCRIGWILENKAAGAEKIGKLKFVTQTVFLGVCFLKLTAGGGGWLAPYGPVWDSCLPWLLYLSLTLTVVSGISFFASNREKFGTPFFAKFVSAVGVGLIPRAPGTWGSAAGLLLAYLAQFNLAFYSSLLVLLILAGYWAVRRIDLSKSKDPSFVVIDEACGVLVTLWGIPFTPLSAALGFALFRLFDITKPLMIRRLERLPGYWGIMADDLGAGLLAWIVLRLAFGGA